MQDSQQTLSETRRSGDPIGKPTHVPGDASFKITCGFDSGTPILTPMIDAHATTVIAMIDALFLELVQTAAALIASMVTNVQEKPGYVTLHIRLQRPIALSDEASGPQLFLSVIMRGSIGSATPLPFDLQDASSSLTNEARW